MTTDPNHDRFGYVLDAYTVKDIRVLQRNTVYVIGLKKHLASEKLLASDQYFGQYGEIIKICFKKKIYRNETDQNEYYSAFINYSDELSACLAIIAIQSKHIKGNFYLIFE